MKLNDIKKIILLVIILFTFSALKASEWNCIVKLEGTWKFSVGDDSNWAKPTYSDINWDNQNVPQNWEQNYEGYNGYGWYRTSFNMQNTSVKGEVALFLGKIDDVDEVFLNGVKIGQTGSFFPNYKSGWDIERKYIIPKGLLQKNSNILAVRVYDETQNGGIVSGNIGIYYDNDAELSAIDLSGKWKFSTRKHPNVYEKNFDDKNWGEILVPATWESQGYPNHNGLGWYRKKFIIPAQLSNENLYLVLGQIDDLDKIYLNGKLISRTENLSNYNNFNKYRAHQLYRVYELPMSKLEKENVLVVEVMDNQGVGGIYEGPVGIMTYKNAMIINDRNKRDIWDNPIQSFIEFFLNW